VQVEQHVEKRVIQVGRHGRQHVHIRTRGRVVEE
jgi:hypothetical protein